VSALERVALSEIATSVDYGVTASATVQPLGPKFLRITDIQNGSVDWDRVPWCECDNGTAAGGRLKQGDIVFARTGATTGKSFLIRDCPSNAVFASYLIRVRLGDRADSRYVSHYFHTPEYWAQITASARGVAQPGVNASTLKALKIPLPPIAEQRRIAEVLDRAEALRAKRRAALAQLDTLTQSIFREMFGDLLRERDRWPTVSLEEIVRETRLGIVRSSEEFGPDYEFPYVRMNAITRNGQLKLNDVQRTDATEAEVESYHLEPGDFLFNTRNSEELVGKTALFRGDGVYLFNNNVMRIRFRDEADPEFIAAAFRTPLLQNELSLRKSGTTNVFAIYYKDLRSLPLPLPPLQLQRDFARRVATVEKLKSSYSTSLVEFGSLFAVLQHRAFRGEL
jgi:type I restriction enzyme, S subunit